MGEVIVRTSSGRQAGSVHGSEFRRSLQGSKHFLRRDGGGICHETGVLDSAEAAGASVVVVRDTESNVVYTAEIAHIREAGHIFSDPKYGRQVLLPFSGWVKTGASLPENVVRPVQLKLGF